MRLRSLVLLCIVSIVFAGCSTIAEKTNMLSDKDIKAQTSGALGYKPSDLTITGKRIIGVNTYVNLTASDGKQFTCIINGGNLLSLGMTNPPTCSKKGAPVNSNPFQK